VPLSNFALNFDLRRYMKGAGVVLMDEATSALDTKTEAGIMDTLGYLMNGKDRSSHFSRVNS
jgi:ABC-type multidrug transport system fused ATPase/permease subunit